MDRRAVAFNALELIRYSVMTAIVIVLVVVLVAGIVRQTSDTRLAQMSVYDQLFIYSPGGFHVVDAGRSDPLSVDISKFNDKTLDAMLSHPDNKFTGARFVLTDLVDEGTCTKHSCKIYWNKYGYDLYKPLTTKSGSGSALSVSFSHPVTIKTDGGHHPGILNIELVTPAR
jgi:hypothetical protein